MATPQDAVQQTDQQKQNSGSQMIVIGTGDHGDLRIERAHTPEEKPLDDFEKQNGVYISSDHGQYLYYLPGKGSWELLYATDATKEGLEQAKRYIDGETKTLERQLEKDYGVSFSQRESVGRQWITRPDGTTLRGENVMSRPPHLGELQGISAALAHSAPSQYTKEGGAVRFYFLDKEYRNNGSNIAEFIDSDVHGGPAIYFSPDSVKIPVLAKDAAELKKDSRSDSMESLTDHELVHNSQRNTGWDNQAVEEKYAREMGWVPAINPRTRAKEWLLRGKDGEYYNPGVTDATQVPQWYRCNASDQPLNANGQPVDSVRKAAHYTSEQVRAHALVQPPTTYFTNPLEMFAEGLTSFRLTAEDRHSLETATPGFYKMLKDYDQQEINSAYGAKKGGKPLYVRRPDGQLEKVD